MYLLALSLSGLVRPLQMNVDFQGFQESESRWHQVYSWTLNNVNEKLRNMTSLSKYLDGQVTICGSDIIDDSSFINFSQQ
jgi:hypothetical protein